MSGRVRSPFVLSVGRAHVVRTVVGMTVVLALALPGTAIAGSPASTGPSSATGFASVRLLKPSPNAQVGRIPGQPIYADPGIYLASRGGAWQIDIRKPDYGSHIVATQVAAGGTTPSAAVRTLPAGLVRSLQGLGHFFRVSVRDAKGKRVLSAELQFCPFGNDQRVDGTGPLNPTYPRICYLSPFTLGTVIGIDQGWATSALGYTGVKFNGPNGTYHLKLSITKAYRQFFDIPIEDAVANVTLHVTKLGGCVDRCPPATVGPSGSPIATGFRGASSTSRGLTPATSAGPTPPTSTLPDLVALPAWNITTETFAHRDYLDFAATVWDSGPAPLLVEGFPHRERAEDARMAVLHRRTGQHLRAGCAWVSCTTTRDRATSTGTSSSSRCTRCSTQVTGRSCEARRRASASHRPTRST